MLLTGAVVALTCAQSMAITIDDLDGMIVGQMFACDGTEMSYGFKGDYAYAGKFEKTGETTLVLHNYLGGFDLQCTFVNNTLTIASPQNRLNGYGVCEGLQVSMGWFNYVGTLSSSRKACYQIGSASTSGASATVQDRGNGIYQFDFSQALANAYYKTGESNLLTMDFNNGLDLYCFKPNAKATEYMAAEKSDEYDVDVLFGADGNFRIRNWANLGLGYVNDPDAGTVTIMPDFEGTYNAEEWTLTIPNEICGIFLNYSEYIGAQTISGYSGDWTGPISSYYSYESPYAIRGVDGSDIYDAKDIFGTYTPLDMHHNDLVDNAWVSNGGKVTTSYDNISLEFGYNQVVDLGDVQQLAYADNTVIDQVALSQNYTLDAEVTIETQAYNEEDGLTITGNVATVKNGKCVESYDLYIIPGYYTSIDEASADFNDLEKGNVNAVLLTAENSQALREGGADRSFTVNLPAADVIAMGAADGKMTVYAKANYKEGYSLAPTFHSLMPLEEFNTSVESVFDNGANAKVVAGQGVINVLGYNGNVEVFNAQGVAIYSGAKKTINVAPGIYIIRAANTTFKVVVR